MGIRVLRILEYTYRDEQTAADDMSKWTRSIRTATGAMRMRSTELSFDAIEWTENWPTQPTPATCANVGHCIDAVEYAGAPCDGFAKHCPYETKADG